MWIATLGGILITFGVVLLILGTIPVKNTLEGDKLTVRFIIGKKVIDMEGAKFMPVPEDVTHHIIRIGGTSIGSKHSGWFMNTKTKTKYQFYLTGKGEKGYFEIGSDKYLVDDITVTEGTLPTERLQRDS